MDNVPVADFRIEEKLCFQLYAVAKEAVRSYRKPLQKLNLTYTQYMVMMMLWEHGRLSVKDLGKRLYLDSGTLTPVIKKLRERGLVTQSILPEDERVAVIDLSPQGESLREIGFGIPNAVEENIPVRKEDLEALRKAIIPVLPQMYPGGVRKYRALRSSCWTTGARGSR